MEHNMNKLVVELRFSDVIDLSKSMDSFNKINVELNGMFINANFDFANSSFVMSNPIKMCQCILQPNRILIINDKIEVIEDMVKDTKQVISAISNTGLYGNIIRKGVRIYYIKEFVSSSEIDERIKNKLFNYENLVSIDEKAQRLGVHFTTQYKEFSVNYNISSAINNEFTIDSVSGRAITSKSTPVFVIDLDYNKEAEEQSMCEVGEFLDMSVTKSDEAMKKIEGIIK